MVFFVKVILNFSLFFFVSISQAAVNKLDVHSHIPVGVMRVQRFETHYPFLSRENLSHIPEPKVLVPSIDVGEDPTFQLIYKVQSEIAELNRWNSWTY
ncbi:MAG: hypothetical protein AB7F59_04775 [Bdellovibrionales bacterium]